jgi:predicted MPP superfamily phosphohydrolase
VIAGEAREGNCTVYVSRGVGTVVAPIRINCPPEVSVLVLRSAPRA